MQIKVMIIQGRNDDKTLKKGEQKRGKLLLYCIAQIAALNLLLNGGIYSEQDTPPPPLPPYSLP